MQLDDLEPAWKQFKLLSGMHQIASKEILSIIALSEDVRGTKLQRLLLTLFMVATIAIFCQGG